jgi:uncharacterized phage protein gp47/JayE
MAKFTPKRFEQILPQMTARVVARTELSDIADSSAMKQVLAAAARSDSQQYYQMTLLLALFSIDTATGDDLDERAAEIQPSTVTRNLAQRATGTVIFSAATAVVSNITINAGTRVKTASGQVFTTSAAVSITPTSPEQISGNGIGRDSSPAPVTAATPGAAGNVAANTIVKFETKPPGVDTVTNLSATANGQDKETDTSFRNRLKQFIASLARCQVSAIEANVIGTQDETTGATVLFAKVVEDIVNRGLVTVYIDDGTGTAETTETVGDEALPGTVTWNGTTTVAMDDTSTISVGDYIRQSASGDIFRVDAITPNVDATVSTGGPTIPSGAGGFKATDLLTQGLSGPPVNTAVGGESTLNLNHIAIKDSDPFEIYSSTRGLLLATEYTLDSASGQVVFDPVLTTGEAVAAFYTRFTGLIELVQKVVDGDPNDRDTYPGLRAAGVQAVVRTPTVLLQNITVLPTVGDGFDQDDTRLAVQQAIKDYINALNISGDVILAEIIKRVMSVPGVLNVIVTTPVADVPILDDQLARTTDNNITVV